MKNPFEHNKRNLKSGFYFDKKKALICFYYAEEEEDSLFSFNKVYNRYTSMNNLPFFMRDPREKLKDSQIEDLVELDIELFTDRDSIAKDFKWIKDNNAVAKTFVQFLFSEEKYLILEIFKLFIEQKITP
jgi:hypothetical protein